MLKKPFFDLVAILAIVGCGCGQQPASSAEPAPSTPRATGQRGDPPASARKSPENVRRNSDRNPADRADRPADSKAAKSPPKKRGVITLNTGDVDAWPSYIWPLVIKIEVTEVPEGLSKPSPPIPADD